MSSEYEPQGPDFENLAKNKSRLSRRQRVILGLGALAVGTAGTLAALKSSENGSKDQNLADNDPTTETLITPTSPASPEFTVTTPNGETATITTTSSHTPENSTPAPTETETPSTPEVAPNPEYVIYDSLIEKVSSSSLSEQEKSEYISQIENLKQIEDVQKQLLQAYESELGPDGKTPALLYYTQLRFPNTPSLPAESQIFLLQNQKILEVIIRPQIEDLNRQFNQFEVKNALEQISYNTGHTFGPEQIPNFGLRIPLSSYPELLEHNQSQVEYQNLSPEQINNLKSIETELAPLTGNFTVFGTEGFQPSYFSDLGSRYELHINPDNTQSARHEWAHATNIEQNNSIAGNLSPAELVKLATLHQKAITDSDYGRQYGTLDQLFSPYNELNPYTAGASSYPSEIFITNTEANSQEKLYKIEPHEFAVNSQTGEKLTVEEVVKILELGPNHYQNTQEFITAKLAQLEKLSQTSPFYRVFVEMLKKDPSTMDNLATKVGQNSIANINNTSEGDYLRFFVEYYCDSVFTVGLLNGNPEITSVFNNLSPENQRLLLTNSLAVMQHADFETWAESSRFSIESPNPQPRTDNPLREYYLFLKQVLAN